MRLKSNFASLIHVKTGLFVLSKGELASAIAYQTFTAIDASFATTSAKKGLGNKPVFFRKFEVLLFFSFSLDVEISILLFPDA